MPKLITTGGKHRQGGKPLRMNYAGIGYVYDNKKDAFIPQDRDYVWSDETNNWEDIK